ncbi:SDR family NAD(P)-dependent oxidoreductase [Streptomyces lavendulae]|uniref:beta-ketoacyl reductase n=1 Tax=Streptomyces lavendulae TaxID=1914 RepID=UPI0033CA0367
MDAQLKKLAAAVHAGEYRALPYRAYPAHRIEEAFTNLQHSRHIGKIVITFEDGVPVRPLHTPPGLDPEAAYLITGGLAGLGAATARHLAARGARHLALLSRRGMAAPEAAALVNDLRNSGVDAAVHAIDITDDAALRRVLQKSDAAGRRLAGVVHAAMVLDDAPLADLTDDRLHTVLAPKMTGGLLLDRLTRGRALDFFLVYSSAAALFGNIRQAPYVAGNLVLEALVRERRRAGESGLAVQWGAIADCGYVHRTGRVEEMTAYGLGSLAVADALAELDRLLFHSDAEVAAVGLCDWDDLQRALPNLAAPRTAHLTTGRSESESAARLRTALYATTSGQSVQLIGDRLAEILAGIMDTSPERIDRRRRLDLLGVDSLMALEFTTIVSSAVGCELSTVEVASAGGLDDLASRLCTRLGARAGGDG